MTTNDPILQQFIKLAGPEPEFGYNYLDWHSKLEGFRMAMKLCAEQEPDGLLYDDGYFVFAAKHKVGIEYQSHFAGWSKPFYLRPQPPAIPEGWQLVPKDATRKMIGAAWARGHSDSDLCYSAMLSAAPTYKEKE